MICLRLFSQCSYIEKLYIKPRLHFIFLTFVKSKKCIWLLLLYSLFFFFFCFVYVSFLPFEFICLFAISRECKFGNCLCLCVPVCVRMCVCFIYLSERNLFYGKLSLNLQYFAQWVMPVNNEHFPKQLLVLQTRNWPTQSNITHIYSKIWYRGL